ncbi:hypothetical protein PUV_18430 [Parachlamydia acanthamoebae UV-7]|uniref:N-acetyltransferase domain-containing protein n=1 Tax=Parachlamydia acanthamoebae (strain UV7) TaxID=765952 RepID=F8L0P3_PARAV|nr:GNAT family N-acetyltransferase [Parachlamydia acanthamoebae]CCB86793.1 hypothetical protein PUV_18430 [Parachlamydia acanthamoebae UV-7]
MTVKTERLILRPWQDSDLTAFAALNADPRVREFFPGLLSREESDNSVKLASDHIARCGWGFWAASLIETGEFIGFIGLEDVYFQAHFTPAVEIGWRLAFNHWGKGYATEGAKAALKYGFETLRLDQIVSFSTMGNMCSRHVMEKIGMHHRTQDDFDHPNWCRERTGFNYKIGDFGCGEAKLAEAINGTHTIYSFDHIAINDNVIACDMANVPLEDEILDVALFSLSLMGKNFSDYLKEAQRTLRLDGILIIFEPTSRFINDKGTDHSTQFAKDLEQFGFSGGTVETLGLFTRIQAIKRFKNPRSDVIIAFKNH